MPEVADAIAVIIFPDRLRRVDRMNGQDEKAAAGYMLLRKLRHAEPCCWHMLTIFR